MEIQNGRRKSRNNTNVSLIQERTTSSDVTSFLFNPKSNISIEHKYTNGSLFDNYNIQFFVKINYDMTDGNNGIDNNGGQLKQGVFDALFQIGEIDYLTQRCYDSIANTILVGITLNGFNNSDKYYSSFNDDCFESNIVQKDILDTVYFEIKTIEKYKHNDYGDGLVLTGEFNALLQTYENLSRVLLPLENGKFRILLTE